MKEYLVAGAVLIGVVALCYAIYWAFKFGGQVSFKSGHKAGMDEGTGLVPAQKQKILDLPPGLYQTIGVIRVKGQGNGGTSEQFLAVLLCPDGKERIKRLDQKPESTFALGPSKALAVLNSPHVAPLARPAGPTPAVTPRVHHVDDAESVPDGRR